jgi:dihydrofolate synthase/folylpolyglutamate synthase
MDIKSALDKLYSLHQFGVKLGLDNITGLLKYIGNPHQDLKSFHIAGSNGKGSTASFLASILFEAGYKTGLYTSPHLMKFNERIRINGVMIPDEYVCGFMEETGDYINRYSPTFFELTTAMAFKYFKDHEVDYAVIETGLGGRLDATNVINPLACIITSISSEHTNILGDSILKISEEKAGIIKPGSKVFLSLLPGESIEVFENKAGSLDCDVYKLSEFASFGADSVSLEIGTNLINIYKTPMRGDFQLRNSALAAIVLLETMPHVGTLTILKGIKNVVQNSGIAGRFEIYNNEPRIIIDGAHNLESIEGFISEFRKEYQSYDSCILIFGSMKDKNIPGSLKKLAEFFDNIYATSINYERAATIKEIVDTGKDINIDVRPLEDAGLFIKDFKKTKLNNCLVVLGSIYVIGEIKIVLERN